MSALRRALGLPSATALVVGTIIGSSIFVQASELTTLVPHPGLVVLAWAVAGVLTLIGALVCAELSSAFPRTGGVYVFFKEIYSPTLGFIWGWAMFWTMHSGILAAIAMVFARYAGYFVPLGDSGTKAVAMAAVLLLSAVNYRGVKHGSVLQTAFTAGKLLAVLAMIALGFAFGAPAHEAARAASAAAGPAPGWGAGDFAVAMVAGLFAFGGWHMVTYNAEETQDPRRTIPRALLVGTLVVTACYVLLNAVYLHVLPVGVVATSTRVGADAADAVFGRGGGAAMSALVVFSTFGGLAGIVLAGPRVYFAIARDGLLFPWVGAVHPRFHTPHRAIVLQAVWACVLVGTGTYRALFTRVVYTEWIFFGLMAVGLILLRRRADVRRDYEVWGYPWVPLVFAASAFAIVANQVVQEPAESLTGLGLVLAGLPVYWFWARRGYARGTSNDSVNP